MDKCPNCKVSWVGDKISDDIKEFYSGTHWRREIHIDGGYMGIYDGIVAVMCPDCKSQFPRDNSSLAQERFNQYIEKLIDVEGMNESQE